MRLAGWLTGLGALGILLGDVSAAGAPSGPGRTPVGSAGAASGGPPASSSPCASGQWNDRGVCVRFPGMAENDEGPELQAVANQHRDKSGAWKHYDQIPRRPERPASYEAYRYPIPPGLPGGTYVISGYDLDRPDDLQRRGRRLKHVGHGGLDLPQTRGTPVQLVNLEHQTADAEVLFVGDLFGHSVVTKHVVREGERDRDYLVLYGHLDHAAPGLTMGAHLPEGAPLGAVGDSGSPELVHLHLEVRRAREGVDLAKMLHDGGPGLLVADWVSVVCDPRNVLPLATLP
ncbi:MAG: M23 family metallopeptidase [Polyangiaceae bacterium]